MRVVLMELLIQLALTSIVIFEAVRTATWLVQHL